MNGRVRRRSYDGLETAESNFAFVFVIKMKHNIINCVFLQRITWFVACAVFLLLMMNFYSNDPIFYKIDSSKWSVEDNVAGDSSSADTKTRNSNSNSAMPPYLLGEKGYTMCVSEDPVMLTSVKYIVTDFRTTHKSQLPISIAHCSELSKQTTDELHRLHRASVIQEFGSNATILSRALLETTDICKGASVAQKKRLRGFFCKAMAMVMAPFRETMLVDTDVIWLKNPDLLFQSPQYKQTGTLFFRDRLLLEHPGDTDGLQYEKTKAFIERLSTGYSGLLVNSSAIATRLFNGFDGSANYFWNSAAIQQGVRLRHVQESSVVMINRAKVPKTIQIIRQLIPSFNLGYGDKEIYWIAATIAGEEFALEPFLAGTYGECGEVIHFDPAVKSGNSAPFFINGQFLAEDVAYEGKGIQAEMSKPLAATTNAVIVEMGDRDPETGGNHGGCAQGCNKVPTDMSATIIRQQKFQLHHVPAGAKTSLYWSFLHAYHRLYKKLVPSFLN